MSEVDAIRTIAKTKEILEKLNKLVKEDSSADGNPIAGERLVARLSGAAASGTSKAPLEGATDATGSAVTAANTVSGAAPNFDGSSANNPGNAPFPNDADILKGAVSGANGTSQTNLSGGGSSPASGGSNILTQGSDGTQGVDSEDYAAMANAMEAAGYSEDQIADAIRTSIQGNSEAGTWSIGNVMSGKGGTEIYYPPSNTFQNQTAEYERLIAVTGLDLENGALGVMVRFDGQFPTPTDLDQAAGGFVGTWTNPNNPPVDNTWQSGYYWDNHVPGGPAYKSTPEVAARAYLAYYNSGAVQDITGQYRVYTSLTADPLVAGQLTSYTFVTTVYVIGTDALVGPSSSSISRVSCTPGTDNCPITAPMQLGWPATASYVLSLSAGRFITNAFDLEVAPQYQHLQSEVRIQDKDGNITAISPAINGGVLFYDPGAAGRALYYDSNMALRAIVAPADIAFYLPK